MTSIRNSSVQNWQRFKPAVFGLAVLVLGLVIRLGLSNIERSQLAWLPWQKRTPITLYFADPSGRYLVPVSRTLSGDSSSPQTVLDAFLDGPALDTGLVNLLPSNTEVLSFSIDQGIAKVDLSFAQENLNPALSFLALRQSLLSWPEIKQVEISNQGVLVDSPAMEKHLLYYVENDLLVAIPTDSKTHQAVLNNFLEGSEVPGVVGLPSDVRLLEYEFNPVNGLLSLNFSYTASVREFGIEYPEAMRKVLVGLIATMTAFPEIEAVTLNFENHARLGLGQCADLLRAPQIAPTVLNDERLFGN